MWASATATAGELCMSSSKRVSCPKTWRASPSEVLDRLFHLRHVRPRSHPFVEGEVLVDADQPEALSSRSLEIKVRVGHLELLHETRLENLAAHLLHVVRFDLEPDRSEASQELALIGDVSVKEPDVEVVSNPNEVPLGICLHDLSAEDVTVELSNLVSLLPRDQNGGMVSKNDLRHWIAPFELGGATPLAAPCGK